MGGHHLILGQLTDFISGDTLDDTLDERYRQKIARLLVTQKGYAKSEIASRHRLRISVADQSALLTVAYTVRWRERTAMVIHFGPGSLVSRHRPALAMGRLIAPYQIPLVVVTNGEQADILDGSSGKPIANGLDQIPTQEALAAICEKFHWPLIEERRRQMESRILMAFEVNDRCPCDDTVCTLNPTVNAS